MQAEATDNKNHSGWYQCDVDFEYVPHFASNMDCGQIFTHLSQPMQLSGATNLVCLCQKKLTLPKTCFGQASMHFQQAMQSLETALIQDVSVIFISALF